MMNENAVANLLLDVDFLDEELKRNGHSHSEAFTELRSVRPFALPFQSSSVHAFSSIYPSFSP